MGGARQVRVPEVLARTAERGQIDGADVHAVAVSDSSAAGLHRDALRTRHGDLRVHRFVERYDFDEVGKGHLRKLRMED